MTPLTLFDALSARHTHRNICGALFCFSLFSLLLLTGALSPAQAATLTVPGEYTTIQAAINASSSGDTVQVAAGTYTGSGNVDLDFGGRNITLQGAGASTTIINCAGTSSDPHLGIDFHSHESSSAVVEGLTIENGYSTDEDAGAVEIDSGCSPSFLNCVFTGNTSGGDQGFGGAISISYGSASSPNTPSFTNCLFTHNTASGSSDSLGGALYFQDSGTVSLIHCTFSANSATGTGYGGAVANNSSGGGTVSLTDCILYGDMASSGANEIGYVNGSTVNASYCDVQGGGYVGTGNFNANPDFASATDFHLTAASPCIDAGTPVSGVITDLEGNHYANPPSVGCYEFAGHPQLSVTGTNFSAIANQQFSGQVATFSSADPNAQAGDFTVRIDWGDNSTTPGTITANGNDPNTGAALFTVTGTHTYHNGGSYTVTTTVTQRAFNTSAQGTGTATVNAAPVITTQPTSQTVYPEQSATFTAAASGYPAPTVQWQVSTDGGSTFTPITGATSTSYTISSATLSQNGSKYEAVFTNSVSTATTRAATLTVTHINPIHVSPSGSDSNPGTQASPKLTLQAGINATESGDTVIVAAGTYTGSGNVDLDFGGRNITLMGAGASSTIIDCGGQSASNHRGFLFISGETSSAIVQGFTVENGYQSGSSPLGGAVGIAYGSSPSFLNCIFTGNTVDESSSTGNSSGGAVYVVGGTTSAPNNPTFTNCVFTHNTASSLSQSNGGAIYFQNKGTVSLIHCTFSGNTSNGSGTNTGGAIQNNGSGTLSLTDCILSGDTATYGSEIYYNNGTTTVTNCDIAGSIDHTTTGSGTFNGTGNFDVDPQFVNPGGGNYHISATSPCVGAGTPAGAATDLDGVPYADPPAVGCYQPQTLLVPSASYPTIQAAINASFSGDTVSVAAGTYTDTGNVDLDFGGRDILLLGAGASSTIINCAGSSSANHRGFYFHSGETSSAVVQGFTVENGYQNDAQAQGGAAVIYFGSSPTFLNCVFTGNTVDDESSSPGLSFGGAVYVAYGTASSPNNPTFTNCLFTGNTARSLNYSQGGAFYFQDSGTVSLIHCTFSGNTATSSGGSIGGAVEHHGSSSGSLSLTDCILYGDTVSSGVSEIDHQYGGTPTVLYCDVQGGYAGTGNFSANPDFASATDFHLTAPSPCIDAGTPVSGVTADLDGNAYANPPSVGCYEYNGPPQLSVTGQNFSATANQPFSGTVATFQSADPNAQPGDFTASIAWGDGTTSAGTLTANGNDPNTDAALFNITGTHTYTTGGQFTVTTTVTQTAYSASAQGSGTATVNAAPTITTQPVSQAVNAGQTVTFTAAATGYPTPTVQWQVSTDGGNTFTPISGATSTTLIFTATVAQNGNEYEAVFTNSAGSATTNPATLTVTDTTPPTTTATLTGTKGGVHGSAHYYNSAVQVTLSATDPNYAASTLKTYYSLDGGANTLYSAPFTVTGDQKHTIVFYSVNPAGNQETPSESISFLQDTMPPVSTASLAQVSSGIQVTISATDNFSGVSHSYYYIGNGAIQTYTGPFVVPPGGPYKVVYYSVDNAGNQETPHKAILLDMTPPVSSASATPVTGGDQVTISATDDFSGVSHSYYFVDNGAVQTYSGAFVVSGAGWHKVVYYSVDNAGNQERPHKAITFTVASP